jgi:predicted Zn-dependent peptidase
MKPAMIAVIALLLMPGAVFGAKKWEKIKSPPLRDITVPTVERESMANGIELFILEDHELPLFRMTLVMKGGAAYNPTDKLGLAGITAEVLRSGGSNSMSGDELDELLESTGGSVETEVGREETTIRVNVLIENAEDALRIVRDLLNDPAYPDDKIELALTQQRSAISRRNDDAGGIADREFNKILWGKDHPFAQQIEYEDLANIGRDDLLTFHKRFYHPDECYIALWGDFSVDEAKQMVRNVFGDWAKANVRYPEVAATPATTASVNLAVKESVNQSNIRLGHRSVTRNNSDYHALVVMNEILGGGLGSRLFNEVRSRQGLAYRVGSGLGAGFEQPDFFRVVCGTKSETTMQAIRACVEQVEKMKNEPVEDDELERAKSGLLNSHVFNFANKGAIVNRQMTYVRHGYPADWVQRFATEVQKVSKEDIQTAAANFLHPDNFAIMVVGKPEDFDEDLSALGDVNMIDITIPEPKGPEFPEPTPETLAQGSKVMAAAAGAAGGQKALRKVTNLTENLEVTLSMMGQQIPAKATRYMKYPGNMRVEFTVMGQEMVQVYNDENGTGYMQSPQGKKAYEAAEIADAKDNLAVDLINFLGNFEAYEPYLLGEDEVEGRVVQVVAMTPPHGGKKFKVFVDAENHRVMKTEHPSKNFQGAPVTQEEFYKDYKKVGSVMLPHTTIVHQDGEMFMQSKSTSISVTKSIPDDKFAQGE